MSEILSSQCSIGSEQTTNKFVIPKKQSTDGLLIDLETNEEDIDKQVIETRLKESYFDKLCKNTGYARKELKKVCNKQLEDQYAEKLKKKNDHINLQKRKDTVQSKSIQPVTKRCFYYVCKDEQTLMEIVKNGFTCQNSDLDDDNVLGSSKYGIHLSKHLDITLLYQYHKKVKSFYVLMVKAFYTNFRITAPNPEKHKDVYPDTVEGVDFSLKIPDNKQPIRVRYYNSLIYMFDYDESHDVLEKPKNLLPWAVLKYDMQNVNSYNKNLASNIRPILPAPKLMQRPPFANIKFRSEKQIISNQIKPKPTPNLSNKQPKAFKPPPPLLPFQTKPAEIIIVEETIKIEPVTAKEEDLDVDVEEEEEEQEEEDDWAEFYHQYYIENYSSVIEELYMKPPRWRIIYERTGRLDVKFRGEKQMGIKLDDICGTKLKFVDPNKTRINVKDPTNNLILTYQNKRLKNLNVCNSASSSLKENDAKRLAVTASSKPPNILKNQQVNKHPQAQTQLKPRPNQPQSDLMKKKVPDPKDLKDPKDPKDTKDKKRPPSTPVSSSSSNTSIQGSIKKEKTDPILSTPKSNLVNKTPKKDDAAKASTSKVSSGLSSEMTSLEKRLLTKSSLITAQKPATKPATSQEATSNVRENLKKLLDQIAKTQKATKSSEAPKEQKTLTEVVKPKRKKSFWEPDSDTEFDKLKKCKYTDTDTENDFDDDIVVITRVSLPNLPSMQYSKQYYDSNIQMFEAELKKFLKLNNSDAQVTITNNIASMSKTPIKSNKPKEISQLSQENLNLKQMSRRERYLLSKQRFVHHIRTNNFPSDFDVDNLKNLNNNLTKTLNKLTGSFIDTKCVEIHSGGFGCIEEHQFQNMRRTQSFDRIQTTHTPTNNNRMCPSQSMVNLHQETLNICSSSNKKISLNDYVSTRVVKPAVQAHNDSTLNEDKTVLKTLKIQSPERELSDQTVDADKTLSGHSLPSLCLIDEVKKRVKEEKAGEIINVKEEPKSDLNELEEDGSARRLKRKSKHKKKSKTKRKKIEKEKSHKKRKKSRHHHHKAKKSESRSSLSSCSSSSSSLELSSDYDALKTEPLSQSASNTSFTSSPLSTSSLSSSSTQTSSSSSNSLIFNKKRKKKSRNRSRKRLNNQNEEDGEITIANESLISENSKKSSSHKPKQNHHKTCHKSKHHKSHQKILVPEHPNYDLTYDFDINLNTNSNQLNDLAPLNLNSNSNSNSGMFSMSDINQHFEEMVQTSEEIVDSIKKEIVANSSHETNQTINEPISATICQDFEHVKPNLSALNPQIVIETVEHHVTVKPEPNQQQLISPVKVAQPIQVKSYPSTPILPLTLPTTSFHQTPQNQPQRTSYTPSLKLPIFQNKTPLSSNQSQKPFNNNQKPLTTPTVTSSKYHINRTIITTPQPQPQQQSSSIQRYHEIMKLGTSSSSSSSSIPNYQNTATAYQTNMPVINNIPLVNPFNAIAKNFENVINQMNTSQAYTGFSQPGFSNINNINNNTQDFMGMGMQVAQPDARNSQYLLPSHSNESSFKEKYRTRPGSSNPHKYYANAVNQNQSRSHAGYGQPRPERAYDNQFRRESGGRPGHQQNSRFHSSGGTRNSANQDEGEDGEIVDY